MKFKLLSTVAFLLIWSGISYAGSLKYDTTLRDSILNEISGASIPERQVNILRYGAKGDGKSDCRKAFEKAMKEAEKSGGIHITVPAGVYFMEGPLNLKSNVCIELDDGAVLKFSPDPKHYPIVNTSWEGTYLHNYSPFIYGYGIHDVAIIGRGTIDGNAMSTFATWKPNQKPAQMRSRDMNHNGIEVSERVFGDGDWLRPHLMQFYDCRNVTLQGVKMINSPFWCVHLLQSENVICRSLRYDAKLVNNDGIDPESSRNILIEDIYFDNGDDNIAIKSGRDNDGWSLGSPCENVIIRNCHFKGLHAVVIGSEMSGGVRNVFVEDCDYAGYCKRGIYVKTNPDRGGFVKNLFVNNCRFDEVEDLFYITSKYAGEGLDNDHFSEIENVYVNGLICNKASKAALVLQGTSQKPIKDVIFDNIAVGEAKIGVSFSDTRNVTVGECHIGGMVDVPSQVTPKDRLFDRQPTDSVSYSFGYMLTVSLFAGKNDLVQSEDDFQEYIKGIEDNLSVNPSAKSERANLQDSTLQMPQNAYDLGKFIADSPLIASLNFPLDKSSFISGARDLMRLGGPLIPRQKMEEIFQKCFDRQPAESQK